MDPIRKILYCLALTAIATATVHSQAAPEIPKGPWTELYNQKDFTGWSYAGNPPWSISNGILTAKGGTIKTMLIWNQPLKDLEIEVTYRLSTSAANGGIQVRSRCKERTDAFPKCGNYQVCGLQLDVAMNHSGKLFDECFGFLVNSGQNVDDCRRSLKVGEWMTTTARFKGPNVSLWLNGAHCLDYTLTKVDDLQGSIFALQSHSPYDPIDYKSVRIRNLEATSGSPGQAQGPGLAELAGARRAGILGSAVKYDIPDVGGYSVRLVDAYGVVAMERRGMGPIRGGSLELPSAGIYFLEVDSRGVRSRHKVVGLLP